MSANDKQIGGNHYKTTFEHWDLVIFLPMGYLEGCATKYVCRWRKKEGLKDLMKAQHYLDKLIESFDIIDLIRLAPMDVAVDKITEFSIANDLTAEETEFMILLSTYSIVDELHKAREILNGMIQQAEQSRIPPAEPTHPGTPEDGGHHEQSQPQD